MTNGFDFVEQIHDLGSQNSCPVHVVAAVLKPDFSGKRRVVSGRGVTREEALRTCLAEATERCCAIFRETIPGVWGTESEMAPAAISPESLLLISDQQYKTIDDWNCTVGPEHPLPRRRDAKRPIFWLEARSLTGNAKVLVPAAYCLLGYPHAAEQGFPMPDSNGLAAGENIQTCIERGLLELVERDAVAIWWYNRIPRPLLQFDHTELPLFGEVNSWIANTGRKLWVLDLSNDFNVPVAAAITCDERGSDLSFGFAPGWTKEAAAEGALGELIQFDVTKILNEPTEKINLLGWCLNATVDDHPFLQPSPSSKVITRQPYPQDLSSLLSLFRRKGIEVIALDLSEEEAPFFVARVLTPGLRHLWPRLAQGRLYDVAVNLGWSKCRLKESE